MNTYYFIVPALKTYETDEEGSATNILSSIAPSVYPLGKWVGDCRDNENYLIKSVNPIDGYTPLSDLDFDSQVSAIGLNPEKVKLWNAGW